MLLGQARSAISWNSGLLYIVFAVLKASACQAERLAYASLMAAAVERRRRKSHTRWRQAELGAGIGTEAPTMPSANLRDSGDRAIIRAPLRCQPRSRSRPLSSASANAVSPTTTPRPWRTECAVRQA